METNTFGMGRKLYAMHARSAFKVPLWGSHSRTDPNHANTVVDLLQGPGDDTQESTVRHDDVHDRKCEDLHDQSVDQNIPFHNIPIYHHIMDVT